MRQKHEGGDRPPFSYPVKVGHISANAVSVHVEASDRELEALANLWQVVSVKSLKADLQVARWKKDGVRLKGQLHAEIVQSCVVTLEPVEAEIKEAFEQVFVPEGSKLARIMTGESAEMLVDPDGPDLPETFSGDTIDAGAVVAEFAALAIDPYPRKQDVEFPPHLEGNEEETPKRPSPFAVLKDWKKE